MNPAISVVVPVYNTARYLPECLDSLLNQSLRDLEVIAVNDGSTDDSLSILKEYARRSGSIKVIDKKNGGLGHAYNTGLNAARGEFGMLESDDRSHPAMYEALYGKAKQFDLDVSRGGFCRWNSLTNSRQSIQWNDVPLDRLLYPGEFPSIFFKTPSIWGAIYKASFLRQYEIDFLETPGASYQDTSFNFKVNLRAEKMMVTAGDFVDYRTDNEESSSNSSANAFSICEEYCEIARHAQRSHMPHLKKVIAKMKYLSFDWNLNRLNGADRRSFCKHFSKEMRSHLLKLEISSRFFNTFELKRVFKVAFFPRHYA